MEHEEQWEALLGDLVREPEGQQGTLGDHRATEREVAGSVLVDLATWPSEEALKTEVGQLKECRAAEKSTHVLIDTQGNYYLVARSEDVRLSVSTHLGSVGGGGSL